MLAAGNAVVFSSRIRVRARCRLLRHANQSTAGPTWRPPVWVTVASPSIDNTNALIGDARINMLVATGGRR